MRYDELIEEGSWQGLLASLGSVVDVSATARAFGAFQRPRGVRSAADLLRLALVHAAGLPLRQAVAWAEGMGAARLAAPSLHGRLINCGAWLEHIARQLLEQEEPLAAGRWSGYRLRVMDATCLRRPGDSQTTWRVHVGYSLGGRVDALEVTDHRAGEHLRRFASGPGDICLADRGFAKARDLLAVMESGADVVVRVGWRSLRLRDEQGRAFDLFGLLDSLGSAPASRTVLVEAKGRPPFPLRLVAARLPPEQAETARQKAAASSRKRGKQPDPRSLAAAGFVMIATSLGQQHDDQAILDLYRLARACLLTGAPSVMEPPPPGAAGRSNYCSSASRA